MRFVDYGTFHNVSLEFSRNSVNMYYYPHIQKCFKKIAFDERFQTASNAISAMNLLSYNRTKFKWTMIF